MHNHRALHLLLQHRTYVKGFTMVSSKSDYRFRFQPSLPYLCSASHSARLISFSFRSSAISVASNLSRKLVFVDEAISSNVLPARPETLSLTSLIILSLSFSEGTFRTENILFTLTLNNIVPCCSNTPFFLVWAFPETFLPFTIMSFSGTKIALNPSLFIDITTASHIHLYDSMMFCGYCLVMNE